MRVTGLCGGIGAGKSTVASQFAAHGALVIDVDQIGREVLDPGGRAFTAVVEAFGVEILLTDEDNVTRIDRAKLAPIVFNDPAQLVRLEQISHPAINAELDAQLVAAAAAGHDWVVLDMAVLVESNLGQDLPSGHGYDVVVVVEAAEATRIERLVNHRGMTPEDAQARISSQTDDETRRQVADIVVANNGDLNELAAAISVLAATLSRPLS